MADGSHKPIEAVRVGEKVRGKSGVNTVLGYHRPMLDGALYALNDGEAFVTEEHPFLTTDGWKAINPAKTRAVHNLNIEVGTLQVGDTLVTENGPVKLTKFSRVSPTELAEDFPAGETPLFNLLLDGTVCRGKYTTFISISDNVQELIIE
jgi:hypothetical protein